MGDALVLTGVGAAPADVSDRLARLRAAVGLVGLFASTLALTLTAMAIAAELVPGWSSTVVASGSMAPALRPGDIVLNRHIDAHDVGLGSIIVFVDDTGTSVVHRVVDTNRDGSLTTRGDANRSDDSAPVLDGALTGVGFAVVPWVGLPRVWIERGELLPLGALLLGVFGALLSSRWAWSADEQDPWQRRRSAPGRTWVGRPAPDVRPALVPASTRTAILERARSCR